MKKLFYTLLILLLALYLQAAAEENIRVSVDGFDIHGYSEKTYATPTPGIIRASEPFSKVTLSVYDIRSMGTSVSLSDTLAEPVTEYDMTSLCSGFHYGWTTSGEKRLNLTLEGEFGSYTTCLHEFFIYGQTADTFGVSYSVGVTNRYGNEVKDLTRNRGYYYGWISRPGDFLTFTLPPNTDCGAVYLQWEHPPKDFTLAVYDADGRLLEETVSDNPDRLWNILTELPEGARSLRLSCENPATLLKYSVFERGKVPESVQRWEPWPEKADLMLITAHKNDESLYFSGSISRYIAEGKNVCLVVLTENGTRHGQEELFECCWLMGMRYQPLVLEKWDGKASYETVCKTWGGYEECVEELVEIIRRFRPEVIMTHDRAGEFGHIEHIITSDMTIDAVERSSNEEQFPASAQTLGVWDVKKLYVHLYGGEEERLYLKFDEPLPMFGNRTAMEMAYAGFNRYQSQIGPDHPSYSLDADGKDYDKTCFGLFRSTVGPDVKKDSLFENID